MGDLRYWQDFSVKLVVAVGGLTGIAAKTWGEVSEGLAVASLASQKACREDQPDVERLRPPS